MRPIGEWARSKRTDGAKSRSPSGFTRTIQHVLPTRSAIFRVPLRALRFSVPLGVAVASVGCAAIEEDLDAIQNAPSIEIVDGGDVWFRVPAPRGYITPPLGPVTELYDTVTGGAVDEGLADRTRREIQEEYAKALQEVFPDKEIFARGRSITQAHADPQAPVCGFYRYGIEITPDPYPSIEVVMSFRLLPLPMPQQSIIGGLWVSEPSEGSVVERSLLRYPLDFTVVDEKTSWRKKERWFSQDDAERAIHDFAQSRARAVAAQLAEALGVQHGALDQ